MKFETRAECRRGSFRLTHKNNFNEVANSQTSLSLSQLRLIIRISEAIIKFLLDDFSRSKCGVVQVRRKQFEIFQVV